MRPALALLACAFAACAARPPPAAAVEEVYVPTVRRPPTPVAPATLEAPVEESTLENTAGLERFFDVLGRLDDGTARDDVVVTYFGDSHTAADFQTGAVRRLFAARFGSGGRGFVSLGKPYGPYVQDGVRTAEAGATRGVGVLPRRPKSPRGARRGGGRREATPPPVDGLYGLVGAAAELTRRGAQVSVEVAMPSATVALHTLTAPSGGPFEVWVDGRRTLRLSSRGAPPAVARHVLPVAEGPHRVEVRATGPGVVRVLGASFDHPKVGVVLDALGLNGARLTTLLRSEPAHLASEVAARRPALVVFAYGTNESDDDTPPAEYERNAGEAVARILAAAPEASCLVVGPPDRALRTEGQWVTPPRLFDVVAAQRRVAAAAGCAFFDQLAAMGGAGTAAAWALEDDPRARPDRVHFTPRGYRELGERLGGEVLRAYVAFRAARGFDASRPIRTELSFAGPAPTRATSRAVERKERRPAPAAPRRRSGPPSSAPRGGSRRTPGTRG